MVLIKKIFVAENEKKAQLDAKRFYKKKVKLTRDTAVLDTWFSSGLWPFATLGWPNSNYYLKRFYPTSVLVTGFDIIFLGSTNDDVGYGIYKKRTI